MVDDAAVPDVVGKVYGPHDLAADPAFAGGFINFGLWDGIDLDGPLTVPDRVRSQRQLYARVLGALAPAEGRRAVEVGCGIGLGCALALGEYGFAEVTGVDIHPAQLERARRANAGLLAEEPRRLRFVRGAAERLPLADGAVDRVYSVEAAQHFRDLPGFAREAARVLRPGGLLAVSSFFVPEGGTGHAARLAGLLDSFATGLDVAHPLAALTGALTGAGLAEVSAVSVGASVWPGWDRWLAGVHPPDSWARNFLPAHRDGLLDYYLVTARRPAA
ncbi:hypothetical protein GCM10027168_38600 [Streptomyces capparidis]